MSKLSLALPMRSSCNICSPTCTPHAKRDDPQSTKLLKFQHLLKNSLQYWRRTPSRQPRSNSTFLSTECGLQKQSKPQRSCLKRGAEQILSLWLHVTMLNDHLPKNPFYKTQTRGSPSKLPLNKSLPLIVLEARGLRTRGSAKDPNLDNNSGHLCIQAADDWNPAYVTETNF